MTAAEAGESEFDKGLLLAVLRRRRGALATSQWRLIQQLHSSRTNFRFTPLSDIFIFRVDVR
jgi:hypothetical protein